VGCVLLGDFVGLPSLSDRRAIIKLCRDFLQEMRDPSSCIHHLSLPRGDTDPFVVTSEMLPRIPDFVTEPRVTTRSWTMLCVKIPIDLYSLLYSTLITNHL